MAKLSTLVDGTVITFAGKEWFVLPKVVNGGRMLLMKTSGANIAFDTNDKQKFSLTDTANVGYYLNTTFWNTLNDKEKSVVKDGIFNTSPIYRDEMGSTTFPNRATITCKVGLLSFEDWKKYSTRYAVAKAILPNPNPWLSTSAVYPDFVWTLSPIGDSSYSNRVWIILADGGLNAGTSVTADEASDDGKKLRVQPVIFLDETVEISNLNEVVLNSNPTITVTSPTTGRTLYENDVFNLAGSVSDTDVGNVVSVKYSINGSTARAILGSVSQGSAIAFAKNLTYKSGKLYDGTTAITATLAEGSQHTLEVWGEDDKGGKSPIVTRTFYVVPNRAATLTLDAFVTRTGLINTDVVNISGKVADLDNGNVIVKYKIGNGAYTQVFSGTVSGTPTAFNFNVALSLLSEGENTLTLQAVDAFGAITQQVLTLKKDKVEEPLKTAVTYYQITPPNGTTDGLHLFIERETGDLTVKADIFMGASGVTETFVPMTLASTANLANGNVEDTFSYQHGSEATKIVVRIAMTRTGTATNKAIKKISGVLT